MLTVEQARYEFIRIKLDLTTAYDQSILLDMVQQQSASYIQPEIIDFIITLVSVLRPTIVVSSSNVLFIKSDELNKASLQV